MHSVDNSNSFFVSVFVNYAMVPDYCGGCHNVKYIKEYASQGELANNSNIFKIEEDITYPFLGKTDTLTISGWYFIPVINIPRISVKINKKLKEEIVQELIMSSLKLKHT